MSAARTAATTAARAPRRRLRSEVSPDGDSAAAWRAERHADLLFTPRDGLGLLRDVRRRLGATQSHAPSAPAPSPPLPRPAARRPPSPPPAAPSAAAFSPGTGPNTARIMDTEETRAILRNMLVAQHAYTPASYAGSAAMSDHRRTHGSARPDLRALYIEMILHILVAEYDDIGPLGYEPFWIAVNLFDRAVSHFEDMQRDSKLWTLVATASISVALTACDVEPPSFVRLAVLTKGHHDAGQIREAQGVVVNMVGFDVFAVCANDILGAYIDALPHVRTAQSGHVGEVAHFYAMLAMFSVELAHRPPSQIAYAALQLACETHGLTTLDKLDADAHHAMGHPEGAPLDAVGALRSWYIEWRARWLGGGGGGGGGSAMLCAPAHIVAGMRRRAPGCRRCSGLWLTVDGQHSA